ncbi:MAG TPA: ABC transporter permease [Micromonosporaceae bacterium]|nr:ABC transporter permease [Micromonosporaceae bacterium]
MNSLLTAVRLGVARGWIEFRQTWTNAQDLWNYVFPAVVLLIVMFFMRNATVPGTEFSLGARTLPSVLGMGVVFSGLTSMALILTIEREDGTLLRAKAVPNGMLGYLMGKVLLVAGMSLVSQAVVLVPALFFLDGLVLGDPTKWLTLAWVLAIGLLATMPIGAIVGSLFGSPRNMGMVMLPLMGLVAISGIFYPINGFPGWVQGIAQIFPVYWLGLGMRSALLPAELAAVELEGSWRHLETLGMLSLWAVLGIAVAPVILRRMARREAGSTVAARREKALQRVT